MVERDIVPADMLALRLRVEMLIGIRADGFKKHIHLGVMAIIMKRMHRQEAGDTPQSFTADPTRIVLARNGFPRYARG